MHLIFEISKAPHFGMGLNGTRASNPEKHDSDFLIVSICLLLDPAGYS